MRGSSVAVRTILSSYLVRASAAAACLLTAAIFPASAFAQAPIDVSSKDLAPALFTAARPDGGVDVAWRRSDGKLVLSTFAGPQRASAKQVVLDTNLKLLGGLARDDQGNRYIAALREETATPQEWPVQHRPGVAHVYRVREGADRSELLADVNTAPFLPRSTIINPVHMANGAACNTMMVHNRGTLLWAFGHNNGSPSDIHQTGTLIGLGTDGRAVYDGGGEQHPAYVSIAPDGDGFVAAQIFDQGIGLSTMKKEGGKFVWSNFVLVYEIPRANQAEEALQIAGIIPTADAYLLVFSSGKGWLWNFNQAELGLDGACGIRYQKIARDFDKLPKFDWWNNVRKAQGGYAVQSIAEPTFGKSHVRAIAAPRADGKGVVVFEQWAGPDKYEGVRAVLFDANGRTTGDDTFHPGVRVQKSTNLLVLADGSMAWTTADAAGNRLLLHALDAKLRLTTTVLGQGGAAPNPTPGPAPGPQRILLTSEMLTGKYVRDNPENDYHEGTISEDAARRGTGFVWTNKAGVSWKLGVDAAKYELPTGDDNPYAKDIPAADRTFKLVFARNGAAEILPKIDGFYFNNEFYRKKADAAPAPAALAAAALQGKYVRDNPENGYHEGVIEPADPNDARAFRWKNKEGYSWSLRLDAANNVLVTGEDNPYKDLPAGDRDFRVVFVKKADGSPSGVVEGFTFNSEFYRKAKPAPARLRPEDVAGRYARENPENGYHEGTIDVARGGFAWTNKAGVSWKLSADLEKNILGCGADSPYFETNPDDGRAFVLVVEKNPDGSPRGVEGFYYLKEFYKRVK